jgi:hypothetical protein
MGPAQMTRAIEDFEIEVEKTLRGNNVHVDAKRARVLRELVCVGDVAAALRDIDGERMQPDFDRIAFANEGSEREDEFREADARGAELAAKMGKLSVPRWVSERPAER